MPGLTYFKPAGVPLRFLDEVRLSIEEVEAIRLKDIDDLDQEQCAGKMNISRPTFQRVLESARKKIADALLNGKAVRIEGGNFEVAPLHLRCLNNHEWDVKFETIGAEVPLCPTCNTQAIMELPLQGTNWGADRHGRQCQSRGGWWKSR
jgi:predicted DNA-binding protein (UPF0251 family)